MAEQLMVKCKVCGKEFLSPIQLDRSSFESSTLGNNTYQCPDGHRASYDKGDHFFSS
jgi:hypothetical protein